MYFRSQGPGVFLVSKRIFLGALHAINLPKASPLEPVKVWVPLSGLPA